jgi:hypothetical protein
MDQLATMVKNGSGPRYSDRTRAGAFRCRNGRGKFVILVDDADNPPDREGRGFFR